MTWHHRSTDAALQDLEEAASRQTLATLAAHPTAEIRMAVAGHPACPPDVLDTLADDTHVQVRDQVSLRRAQERLYGTALDIAQVSQRTGLPAQALARKIDAGELLVYRGASGPRIPAWQLTPDGKLLGGIRRLAEAFPGDPYQLSSWLAAPHPLLANRTPREALTDVDLETITALASVPNA